MAAPVSEAGRGNTATRASEREATPTRKRCARAQRVYVASFVRPSVRSSFGCTKKRNPDRNGLPHV